MKALEQLVVRVRSRVREERARRGLGGPPARLDVRLDDFDAPVGTQDGNFKLNDWFESIVRVLEWSGGLPVQIVGRSDHPLLCEIVRFAHRLECPTTLRTDALDLPERADELVDCGLDRIRVRLGVREGRPPSGGAMEDARRAVAALVAARESRGVPLDVVIEVSADPAAGEADLRTRVEACLRLGADGVEVVAPWRGPAAAGSVDAVGWLKKQRGGAHRTRREALDLLPRMDPVGPGAPRTGGSCGVGTARVELLSGGTLRCCPFKADTIRLGDAMAPAWAALAAHRGAIGTCDRACAHPDLLA